MRDNKINIKTEEDINPDTWTQKELLKHLYREVKDLKDEITKLRDSDRIIKLEDRVSQLETDLKVKDAKSKQTLWLIGGIITALNLGLAFFRTFFN